MKDLASAYTILSNSEDRKIYDRFGREGLERREMTINELPQVVAFASVWSNFLPLADATENTSRSNFGVATAYFARLFIWCSV
jgi:DnaJ-class molecular chaperone